MDRVRLVGLVSYLCDATNKAMHTRRHKQMVTLLAPRETIGMAQSMKGTTELVATGSARLSAV